VRVRGRDIAARMLPARAYAVSLAALLAGATCVHRVASPDLTIPRLGARATTKTPETRAR